MNNLTIMNNYQSKDTKYAKKQINTSYLFVVLQENVYIRS